MATRKDMRNMSWDDFYLPVTHSPDHVTTHLKPMMHTFSEDGLNFESRGPVGPRTDIVENTASHVPVSTCAVKTVPKNR
ncbi:hypothetical protein DBB_49550 [Desulfoluna spongiiphila]|nr:hypothetical protein DBB_49550 [Desulfoluna spongiiphila]